MFWEKIETSEDVTINSETMTRTMTEKKQNNKKIENEMNKVPTVNSLTSMMICRSSRVK